MQLQVRKRRRAVFVEQFRHLERQQFFDVQVLLAADRLDRVRRADRPGSGLMYRQSGMPVIRNTVMPVLPVNSSTVTLLICAPMVLASCPSGKSRHGVAPHLARLIGMPGDTDSEFSVTVDEVAAAVDRLFDLRNRRTRHIRRLRHREAAAPCSCSDRTRRLGRTAD